MKYKCKLKSCTKKLEKEDCIIQGINTFCSKGHARSYQAEENKKKQEKEKERREKLYNELSIRITGVDDKEKREAFRSEIQSVFPKYMGDKLINVKVKRRRPKSQKKTLKDKLDTVFSIYIRNRDKMCVVCGTKENLQNGHFLSRVCTATRFDETNCNAQCSGCNIRHEQDTEPYKQAMIRIYGEEKLKELRKKYFGPPIKISEEEYKELIAKYNKLNLKYKKEI